MKDTGTRARVFRAAHTLFAVQGYATTTIGEIAKSAGVSMGMTNHLFGSKAELAALVLNMVVSFASAPCYRFASFQESPLLSTTLATRVNTMYLLNGVYRRFYLDCLEEDVFFRHLAKTPNVTIYLLAEEQGIEVNDDVFLLYGKYVPYSVERTLVLNKDAGLFPGVPYDDIPDYVIRSKMEHFVERSRVDEALEQARRLAGPMLESLPPLVPAAYLDEYLEHA